ncbi:nucleotide exchange factor GrpE [Chelativorans sp. AA-79]|uniref:nucleotide exchange factor GrpE n=1 Tax=Chelativorans sp. AA-79 TaxID=3028735 RepID=UPI0023F8C21B|nr:nucleotide exchange factor GrpE [Chelativorans sp. AA-79]WEX09355.1 nucleotide exchange factor GrpE [Chelativorans sp. AA-79]
MNTHPKDDRAPDQDQAEERAVENGAEAAAFAEGEGAAPVSEEDVLLRLAKENEELKERALRIAAEMENLRKRTQRDVTDARVYGIANFARDMLTVSDNLQRALQAVSEEARAEEADPGFKALVEGVEMTERAMLAALERHGVKRIEPEGEKFDPHFHQAMFEVPNSEVPNNTVVQVVQSGYVIGDRVLRPAMVGVAKGGPKAGNGAGAEAATGPDSAP